MKKTEVNTVVYIGPTIGNIVLTGTAFHGGYPPKVKEEIEKRPYLADLMVPIDTLAEMRKMVRDPESAIGALYQMASRGGQKNV